MKGKFKTRGEGCCKGYINVVFCYWSVRKLEEELTIKIKEEKQKKENS
ncbi:hypothetical protein ACK8P5_03080 [Paenibacillus sp. EC2-1]